MEHKPLFAKKDGVGSKPVSSAAKRQKIKVVVRDRSVPEADKKNDSIPVERKRNGIDSLMVAKSLASVGNVARKSVRFLKINTNLGIAHTERGRHAVHSHKALADPDIKSKRPKKATAVNELHKSTSRHDEHGDASNKHVVPNPTHSDLLDTDVEIDYGDDDGTARPASPQKENTNLAASITQPPFLTKKSSAVPVIGRAFCDKSSITFDHSRTDVEGLILNARHLSKPHGDHYLLRPLPQRYNDFYSYGYVLEDKNGTYVALIQFSPKKRQMNFVRIEFNPAGIGARGICELLRVLKGLFGPDFRNDLVEGNFTRLDATVDIKKIRPADLMIFSDRARVSGLWSRSFNRDGGEVWTTETMTIGSPTSDYFVEAYDKSAQMWKVKGVSIDELITRIEVRFSPRDKDAASMRVKDILRFKNPFAPINVAYYPAPEDGDYHFNFFICAARWYGAEQALKMIKDRNARSRYWNLLLDYEPDWWQPDKLWGQFLDDLRTTGIFPDEIF